MGIGMKSDAGWHGRATSDRVEAGTLVWLSSLVPRPAPPVDTEQGPSRRYMVGLTERFRSKCLG